MKSRKFITYIYTEQFHLTFQQQEEIFDIHEQQLKEGKKC